MSAPAPPDWNELAREHARADEKPRGRSAGRRSILHDQSPTGRAWREEFLVRLEAGDTDANVCAVMRVHVGVFYRWLADGEDRAPSEAEPQGHRGRSPYREFREDITRARSVSRSNHIVTIARAASAGDWRASAWWLARRHPEEFSERHVIENRPAEPETPPAAVPTAIDPSTPEGEEALVQQLSRLPAHVLEQARRRQA